MKKKIETSKKILMVSYIAAIILSAIVVIGSFMMYDMTNVTTLAGLAWAEVASANIYYYKKAQKENVPKILSNFAPDLLEQIDVNQLLNG